MARAAIVLCLLVAALLLHANVAAATYRKPPFNGSIFGKRNSQGVEYEANGRTLSSVCEVATEACAAWFPQNDNN